MSTFGSLDQVQRLKQQTGPWAGSPTNSDVACSQEPEVPSQLTSEQASALGKRGAQSKKIAAVDRRIRELVDSAPPLSEAQKDALVVLLRGTAA